MLDNAASAGQVRALLPGPGPSLVAVTTRWRLAGLAIDGARFVELGPLGEHDAMELLDRVAGPGRTGPEQGAARAVVRLCGMLPLAVCVSGARLAPRPSWPVQRLAEELAGERGRLTALSLSGDLSVRAAFDISYRALHADAARMYRLLSLVPGPDAGAGVAGAATGLDAGRAAGLLDALAGGSLLEETSEGRFRFHDLVRLHAREMAEAESELVRDAVLARSVGWYLGQAVAADLVVIPGRWRLGSRYDRARQSPPAHGSPASALAWLEAALPGLLAALRAAGDHGLDEEAWQLCEALWGLFINRKHFSYWASSHLIGIASARACGNQRAEARMRDQLGYCYLSQRRYDDADAELLQALALDRRDGHRIGEATALEHLGQVDLGRGYPDQALDRFSRAREIHRQIGMPRGIALMTTRVGEAHRDAGRYPEAISSLAEARRLFAVLPDPFNEARALTGLGQALIRAGRPAEARQPLADALTAMTRLGSRYEEARIHTALADAAVLAGDAPGARSHLGAALQIYAALGAPEEAEVRQRHEGLGPAADEEHVTASETDATPP
jgi:tetratricopeptide (TPR) repeat protein